MTIFEGSSAAAAQNTSMLFTVGYINTCIYLRRARVEKSVSEHEQIGELLDPVSICKGDTTLICCNFGGTIYQTQYHDTMQ